MTPQIGRVKLCCGFSTTTASVCRPNHRLLRDTADPLDVSDRADTVCTGLAAPHRDSCALGDRCDWSDTSYRHPAHVDDT